MKTLVFLFAVIILFTACSARPGANAPATPESLDNEENGEFIIEASGTGKAVLNAPSDEDGLPAEDDDPDEEEEDDEEQEDELSPIHVDTLRFYEYFMDNNHIGILSFESGEDGFSDMEMAAYALSELIARDIDGYDYEIGFPMDDMDAAVEKYFGRTVGIYETPMTTVIPETGNVTSTGWGGGAVALVLKELSTDAAGISTGVFYMYHFGMDGIPESESVMRMDIDYPAPFLVTIVFEEMLDQNRELYLRYYAATSHGSADTPYTPYQG